MARRLIGTDTTGTDGSVSIPYTGTGAGVVNLSVETEIDGSIVSGTLSVLDCLIYDDGHTGTASNKWWNWSSYPSTVVRSPSGADYTSITSVNERGYSCFNFKGLGVTKIIFDVYKTGGLKSDILFQLRDDNMGVVCQYALSSFSGLELDTWYTVELDLFNGTVTINNQVLSFTPNNETQFLLSTYSQSETRFRDLKILNESRDKILINASKDVIQSTETTDITGKLYVDGSLMLNTNIDVYKNGSKVDTVNTGSTGTASYTHTGTGAGATEFQFKYGSIVSETLSIYDTLWYDTAITGTDKIWYNTDATTLSVDITPTGTVLSSSASNKRYYANNNNSYGDFTCEFEVVKHTADYTSFVCGNSVISTRLNQALTGSTVKIVREDSTFKQYVNGELVDSQTDTATTIHGIGFRCNANDSIKFKNFKIW